MAKQFDPRRVLKSISKPLLHEFFDQRGELQDVDWGEVTERKVEPIFVAWGELPPTQRAAVQIVLQDVSYLATADGAAAIVEEFVRRAPERLEELASHPSHVDKAMWAYLHVREAFVPALMFAHADAAVGGRSWVKRNSLPKEELVVTDATRDRLRGELTGVYWPKQMRGQVCEVEHYRRANGVDYFFGFLDDYPDSPLVFDDAGELVRHPHRYAFETLFAFDPNRGTLEICAKGGRQILTPLEQAFCRATMDLEVEPVQPWVPMYHLDHLFNPGTILSTHPEDHIVDARMLEIRFESRDMPGGDMTFTANREGPPDDLHRRMAHFLQMNRLSPHMVKVTAAVFQLTFAQGAPIPGAGDPLEFRVTRRSCNIKSKHEAVLLIGERCLQQWEVVRDE